MTMRFAFALLAASLFACAAAPVGEMHAEADNAVSADETAACAVRNAFLRDNANAFKTATLDAIPTAVSDQLNAVNGGSVAYSALATFSVTNVGTVVVAQTTAGASSESGAATTMTQFLSSKGAVLAVATSDGTKISFTTSAGGDVLACSTQQPDGTGPELAGAGGSSGGGDATPDDAGPGDVGDVTDTSSDPSLAP
jgi:hypothetical protein